jgi:hypothetical protein
MSIYSPQRKAIYLSPNRLDLLHRRCGFSDWQNAPVASRTNSRPSSGAFSVYEPFLQKSMIVNKIYPRPSAPSAEFTLSVAEVLRALFIRVLTLPHLSAARRP